MPGHAQYTFGPVTCIDNVIDNDRVGYHQMASYFLNERRRRRAKNETQKSDFQLRVNHRRNVREFNYLETHIQRNGHTLWPSECDDYAFCTVCDDSFSVAHCGGNVVSHGPHESRTRTHGGIEQTVKTNSSIVLNVTCYLLMSPVQGRRKRCGQYVHGRTIISQNKMKKLNKLN